MARAHAAAMERSRSIDPQSVALKWLEGGEPSPTEEPSPKDGSAAAVLAPLREASGPAEVAPSSGLVTLEPPGGAAEAGAAEAGGSEVGVAANPNPNPNPIPKQVHGYGRAAGAGGLRP